MGQNIRRSSELGNLPALFVDQGCVLWVIHVRLDVVPQGLGPLGLCLEQALILGQGAGGLDHRFGHPQRNFPVHGRQYVWEVFMSR